MSDKNTSIVSFWWLQVEILWRTDEMRATKPTVLEEIVTGLDYFRYSLFEAVCTTYRYAENSVNVSNFPENSLLDVILSLVHQVVLVSNAFGTINFDRPYTQMKVLLFRALLNLDRGLVVTVMAILMVSF